MPYKHRQSVLDEADTVPAHEHVNHLTIHDLHESPADHETDHLMSAIGVVKAGEPFDVVYPGPTVVYVVEGVLVAEDGSKPGEPFTAKAGDIVHLEPNTRITCQKALQDAKVLGVTYLPTNVKSMNEFVIRN